jgi:hypothetical protein
VIGHKKNTTLAIVLSLALVGLLTGFGATQSQASDVEAEARQALDRFFGAVMSGDAGQLQDVLAPEFQIQRANGSRYDAASYPASVLPVIAKMPGVEKLVVTSADDIVVTSYVIVVNETLDGALVESHAPRLTVFRKIGEQWRVVAHGNFSAIRQ